MMTIRLLGRASIEGPEGPISGRATQRRSMALLAILAAERSGSVRRDRLTLLLSPESDAERARHLLRDALYSVRTALGEAAVIAAADELTLDRRAVQCDLWDFERAVNAADHATAVRLYGGAFLEGFHLQESPEFDSWASFERSRLEALYVASLEHLADAATTRGAYMVAAAHWDARLALDPVNARATLAVMEALEAAGDRSGALRRAADYLARCRDDAAVPPAPEVLSFAESLRGQPPRVLPPAVPEAAPSPHTGLPAAARSSGGSGFDRVERPHRALLLGGALVLAAMLVAAFVYQREATSPGLDPQRVAVIPFRNATGDSSLEVQGHMAGDWLVQGMAAAGAFTIVPLSTTMSFSLRDPRASQAADLALERTVARHTGAGTIVSGTFYREGVDLLFHAHVTDARDGTVRFSVGPVRTPVTGSLDGIVTIRDRLMAALGPMLDARLSSTARQTSTPPSFEAYRSFADGLRAFVGGDMRGARRGFENAFARDSSYVTAGVWAALARWNGGDHAAAESLARSIERDTMRLAPLDQLTLASILAWSRGDRVAAYEAARRARDVAPGSMVVAMQHANEARRLNRLHEARQIFDAIDPEHAEVRDWAFYWVDRAEVVHLLGDHASEAVLVREARQRHPHSVDVHAIELRMLAAHGRTGELQARLEQILTTSNAPAHGALAREAALELRAHGQRAAAADILQRGIAWFEQQRSVGGFTAAQRRSLARLHLALGHFAHVDSLLAMHADSAASPSQQADAIGRLALARVMRQDTATAAVVLRSGIPGAPPGREEWWRAVLLGARGACDAGVTAMRAALARGQEFGLELHNAPELDRLRACREWQALTTPRDSR